MPQIDGTTEEGAYEQQNQQNDFLSNFPNTTIPEEESEIDRIQS